MENIKVVVGDILSPNTNEDKLDIVCHQVNCKGVMGAGLAKQIKQTFPMVFQHYKDKCSLIDAGIGGLGDVQFCSVIASNGYIVANVFGQDGYGRGRCNTDYDALRKAFTTISMSFPNATIRIPYLMGCGLGGGDWDIVTNIIEETLIDNGVDVEIWKLPSIAKAEEEAEKEKKLDEENENYSIWDM